MYFDNIQVLLVDDDEDDFILTNDLLKEGLLSHTVDWAPGYDEALQLLKSKKYDVLLIDYRLGKYSGIDLLNYVSDLSDPVPVIILTGQGDKQIDVEVMLAGAADYLVKGRLDAQSLERSIRYAIERAEANKNLRENESKFRNIFERSKDTVFLINKEYRITDINPSGEKLLSINRHELETVNFPDFFLSAEEWYGIKQAIDNHEEVEDREIQLKGAAEDPIYCVISLVLQDLGAGIFQGIIHDITQRKKSLQHEQSQEKLASIGRIARMIAHEVRNPLTNINLSLDQLKSQLPEDDSYTLFTDVIQRNSDRIQMLITELLNSTKFSELTFNKHTINDLMDQTLELAKDRITLKGITLRSEYHPEPCYIIADGEKLQIAFLNIIINAIEAMEQDNGVLTIRTAHRDNKCTVTISDNGPGIPKENLDKLFEPFFTAKPKGTGLGLTSTQNIILNHKGLIEVRSMPKFGTTFTVTLNAHSDQASADRAALDAAVSES